MQLLPLWLDNTWNRIVLAFVILVAGLLGAVSLLATDFEENFLDYRRQELKRITQVAYQTINPVLEKSRQGQLTREQALTEVRTIVRNMVYQDDYGKNYVFMSSYDGIMLVQPFDIAREGTDQSQLMDDRGVHIIQSLIVKARDEGQGYVNYYYHPPRQAESQLKVSYVIGISELDAYIGTGMYTGDMAASYSLFKERLQFTCLVVLALIILAQYILVRPLLRSYRQLSEAFARLRENSIANPGLAVVDYQQGSEAERLISGFNALLQDISDKRESLKQSESKFRALFNFANDSIIIFHKGVIVECNDKTTLLLGVDRQEIIGKTPTCFSPIYQLDGQESATLAQEMLDEATKGQSQLFDWRYIRDNREFDVEVSLSRFEAGGKTYALAIIRDITERKQAERELHVAHEQLTASFEEMSASNEELTALYEQLAASDQALQVSYQELYAGRKELAESLDRYRLAMEGSNDSLFDWDIRTDRIIWSERWTDIIGIAPEEFDNVNSSWSERLHPDDRERRMEALDQHFQGKTPFYSVEYRVQTKSGTYIWVLARAKAMRAEDGQVIRMAGSFTDITERKAKDEEIWRLAYRDPLTGLANRRQLLEKLESELALARQGQAVGTLFFFDLDNFKVVNDSCGHGQGDALLIEVANMISDGLGAADLFVRLGGDEFIILFPGMCEVQDISRYADNLLATLSRQFNFCGHSFDLTASIGIVQYPLDGDNADELIKNADTALYVVKNAGKNNWCFFQPAMQQELIRKITTERGLREALDKNQFILYFQPILKVRTGKVSGFEALIRWKKDDTIISPSEFIPMAEQTGLIVPIGKWVLEAACSFAHTLQDNGYGDLFVAVNVSIKQLDEDDFVQTVQQVLRNAAIKPSFLELEITESMLMESKSFIANAAKLEVLRNQGVRIALDDFGTGYSSLTYLRQLPIDVVKLDRSFMDEALENESAVPFMGSLIRLAHNLGLKVVAEGVEQERQYDALMRESCDFLQGYMISYPVGADEAIKFLRK